MNSDAPLPPGSRVAIAGASGLIGSALARSLTADGHEVVRLVRRAPRGKNEVRWDPGEQRIDSAGLVGCAAVVNLAGAGVASRRWTDAYKQTIRSSRVLGTATLAEAIASLDEPPAVFVSGSAIGFYGDTGDRAVDETAPPGDGFLPALCVEWEEAAEPAQEAGVRTVFTRTGLVVAAGAVRGAGCFRSSRRVSAAVWATAVSTGATSPCTTRSRRSAMSSIRRPCRGR